MRSLSRLYDMRVKLHKLGRGSSLEAYINDFGNLAHHLQLLEQKIHYFIFGLKPKISTPHPTTPDLRRYGHLCKSESPLCRYRFWNPIKGSPTGNPQGSYSQTSWNQTRTIFSAYSRYTCEPTSPRHFTTLNWCANSQGINDHAPTPTCDSFRYQSCRPSTTVVKDESRNQALTADETPNTCSTIPGNCRSHGRFGQL